MTAILKVDNLSCRFGSLWAIHNVSFSVERGELLGLIGPNGAGKSTLYNLIAGAVSPTRGEIIFEDQRVTNLRSYEIARIGVRAHFRFPSHTGSFHQSKM